ncbi:MAG TPA: YebC/PmpR family DNA-binding transcriptional regulator, partial [Miltoncostaeaceae bacterium]|nr:YebC/PmpR family DNA-binding transcriptional regulator [Miltoncostaeaceae bacterium]
MSGHSKWATIKRKKGAADAKRGQLFSKLSRAILVAAKEGGPDPESNATLAAAIQKARDSSMPKDNIERAIQRGAGGGEADTYESMLYEGYAPGGVAVIASILTDNRNRTAADLRHIFTKNGGSLGTPGSVAWQFDRKGVILVDREGVDEDELMELALAGGAEDIAEDGTQWQVTTDPADFMAVRGALEEGGVAYSSAEQTMVPKSTVEVSEKEARQILRLIDELEDNDDVQGVYANFDISEEVLEA